MSRGGLLLWRTAAACNVEDEKTLRAQTRTALFVPDELPALQVETQSGSITAHCRASGCPRFFTARKSQGEDAGPHCCERAWGDKYSWYSAYTGILYARAGAAVLTYDPAGEGERNREGKSGT